MLVVCAASARDWCVHWSVLIRRGASASSLAAPLSAALLIMLSQKHSSMAASAHTHTNNNVAIFQRRPCTSRACCSHSREIGSGKLFFLLETHPGDLVGTLQFYQDKNMLNIEIWIFLALW